MLTSKLASVAGFIGAAVLAGAIGLGASSAAFAAVSDGQVIIRVSTTDLNMASEAGARTALRRIQYAANEICGGDVAEQSLGEQMQSRHCANAVVKRAVTSMNLPTLTAISEGLHVTTIESAAR